MSKTCNTRLSRNRKIETWRKASEAVATHKLWMARCGGDLAGYIATYGSVNDPEHYGDGGEAIYAADAHALSELLKTRAFAHDRIVNP